MSIKTDSIEINGTFDNSSTSSSGFNIKRQHENKNSAALIVLEAPQGGGPLVEVTSTLDAAGLVILDANGNDLVDGYPVNGTAGMLITPGTSGMFLQTSYAAVTVIPPRSNQGHVSLGNTGIGFYIGSNLITNAANNQYNMSIILDVKHGGGHAQLIVPHAAGNGPTAITHYLEIQGDIVLGDKCRIFDKNMNLIVDNGVHR